MILFTLMAILFTTIQIKAQSNSKPYSITTFDVSNAPMIDVKTFGGHITVSSRESRDDQVTITMFVKKKSISYEQGEVDLDDYIITIEKTGNTITAHAEQTGGLSYILSGDKYFIHFDVLAPRSSRVIAKTSGGHVKVFGFDGAVILKTSGGHIEIEDLKGGTDVKTSGGHIKGINITGYLEASTSGGHITMINVVGEMQLKTSGGHITIEKSSAEIVAKTSGGNIIASIVEIRGNIDLSTSGGNITITVPRDTGYDLDLKGSSVNTNLDNFSGESKRGKVEGSVNGGGVMIRAKTSGGRISLNAI